MSLFDGVNTTRLDIFLRISLVPSDFSSSIESHILIKKSTTECQISSVAKNSYGGKSIFVVYRTTFRFLLFLAYI